MKLDWNGNNNFCPISLTFRRFLFKISREGKWIKSNLDIKSRVDYILYIYVHISDVLLTKKTMNDICVPFWFTFKVNICSLFFVTFRKKGLRLRPNGTYISTSQTKIRNVCLLVVMEFWIFRKKKYFLENRLRCVCKLYHDPWLFW